MWREDWSIKIKVLCNSLGVINWELLKLHQIPFALIQNSEIYTWFLIWFPGTLILHSKWLPWALTIALPHHFSHGSEISHCRLTKVLFGLQVILSGIWIEWIDFPMPDYPGETWPNQISKSAEFNIRPFLPQKTIASHVCQTRTATWLLTMAVPLCFLLSSLPLPCPKAKLLCKKKPKYIALSTNHNFTLCLLPHGHSFLQRTWRVDLYSIKHYYM